MKKRFYLYFALALVFIVSNSFKQNIYSLSNFSLKKDSISAVYYKASSETDTVYFIKQNDYEWLRYPDYTSARIALLENIPNLKRRSKVPLKPISKLVNIEYIGTMDSQTKSANGLVIDSTTLYAQTADATNPGMLSTGTQSIAGAKTFTTSISSPLLNISGNGTIGGTATVGSKVNIASPSGSTGSINTNQDGVYSYRNGDANRYIRFNTSGTFNDLLSTGAPLVVNFGFAVTPQNVSFFGGNTSQLGQLSIGNHSPGISRFSVKGKNTNNTGYAIMAYDSNESEKFSVRNDGEIKLNGSAISLSGALTTSGAYPITLTSTGSTNVTLPTSGTLITSDSLMNRVPYTGASANVNLGAFGLSANHLNLPATTASSGVIYQDGQPFIHSFTSDPSYGFSTFVGRNAGNFTSATYQNDGFGDIVLSNLTTGFNNVSIGSRSGAGTTSGASNVFLGHETGYFNTIGFENVFVGESSGLSNVTGFRNTYVGTNTGNGIVSGSGNLILGNVNAFDLTSSTSNYIQLRSGTGVGNSTKAQHDGTDWTFTGKGNFSDQVVSTGFKVPSGTASQFLKADGTVDTMTYMAILSGTSGYMPRFTASNTIGDGVLYQSSDKIGLGTTSPGARLSIVSSPSIANVALDISGNNNSTASPDINIRRASSTVNVGEAPAIQFNDESTSSAAMIQSGNGSIQFFNNSNGGGWNERMRIGSDGNIGIGTSSPGTHKLAVNGSIHSTEVKVDLIGWPDYVFDKDYSLLSLVEIEKYIEENLHLPEMPSAKEVEKEGINLGEMNAKLLQKIEELTLHLIEQSKRSDKQDKLNEELQKQINHLKSKL